MPETLTVDSLSDGIGAHRDSEPGTILRTPEGHALRRTDSPRPWRRVTVETVAGTGGLPYQDFVVTYEVTFEGGTPSAMPGWELPHATFPPLERSPYVIASIPSFEVQAERHAESVKQKARALVGWEDDATAGERRQGRTYLRSWRHVGGDRWRTVYEAVVVEPNTC